MEMPTFEDKPADYQPPAALREIGELFFRLPGTVRKLVVVGAALGIVLLGVAVGASAFSFGRAWSDSRFDKDIAERKAKIAELERDRAELIKRAEASEAQALIIQEQVNALKKVATDAALSSRQAEQKAEDIQNATDQSKQNVRDHPMPANDALADVRARLAELDADHK